MSDPILAFRLLGIFQLLPLEAYFYLPLFLLAIGFGTFGAVSLSNSSKSDDVIGVVSAAVGSMLLVAYLYALHWAKQFPKAPGPFEKVSLDLKDSKSFDAAPKAPAQILRSELKSKNSAFFLDNSGRRVFLRGVNFGGNCKLPLTPNGSTFEATSLENPESCSFVGRPIPVDELDAHLCRLRAWGLTFLRLLITWEAVEHEGPGKYDTEYLDYLEKVIEKCRDFGISVFIDPHQDTWSRFTGGDGAPAWTLEKVGFDLEKLHDSASAFTQQDFLKANEKDRYGRMFWISNNCRLAAGTMWTLFFAGNIFCPETKIDGESAQDFLRSHYLKSLQQVARRIAKFDNVIGFDSLNEPSTGFIGQHLTDLSKNSLFLGWRVNPWEAVQLGVGVSKKVPLFKRLLQFSGMEVLNPNGICAWKGGRENCIWLKNGLYKWEQRNGKEVPVLLKSKNFFQINQQTGEELDVMKDLGMPFFKEVAEAIREEIQDAVIFIEPILNMSELTEIEQPEAKSSEISDNDRVGFAWAKHYYEPFGIMSQKFRKYVSLVPVGKGSPIAFNFSGSPVNLATSISSQLDLIKQEAQKIGGGSPTIIGEIGAPFNMIPSPWKDAREDFSQCSFALNASLAALDRSLLNFTLWNYCPVNENDHGDHWNKEDFSFFSLSQMKSNSSSTVAKSMKNVSQPADEEENLLNDLHSGGRALDTVVRPYAMRVAGVPIDMKFNAYKVSKPFSLKFSHDPKLDTNETIIFLPSYQYPERAVAVDVSDGSFEINWESQTLKYFHDVEKVGDHRISLRKA